MLSGAVDVLDEFPTRARLRIGSKLDRDRSKFGNSSLHTRAGVSRGTQCSGSGVSNDARARQRPWISAVLPGTTVATAAKGSPELERRAPSYHRTPRSCIRFTHSLSVIVDFRGGCSTTTHIANDRTSHLTLPRTLGRGSTLTWRSGRHQSGCGWRQSVATSSEAMTAARRSHEDESNHPSQIGAPGRSAGGADRADPVFQPSNGDAGGNRSPVNSTRFTAALAGAVRRVLARVGAAAGDAVVLVTNIAQTQSIMEDRSDSKLPQPKPPRG